MFIFISFVTSTPSGFTSTTSSVMCLRSGKLKVKLPFLLGHSISILGCIFFGSPLLRITIHFSRSLRIFSRISSIVSWVLTIVVQPEVTIEVIANKNHLRGKVSRLSHSDIIAKSIKANIDYIQYNTEYMKKSIDLLYISPILHHTLILRHHRVD